MGTNHFNLHLQRIDTGRNMRRFYTLSLEPDLFGNVCLVRRWGRLGTTGQGRSDPFQSEAEAIHSLLALLAQKKRKGYRPGLSTGGQLKFTAVNSSPLLPHSRR